MRKFLLFVLVGTFGSFQAYAEWTKEQCEAEAGKYVRSYLDNVSTAQKIWGVLKKSSLEHTKVLGFYRKVLREEGLLDDLQSYTQNHKKGAGPALKTQLEDPEEEVLEQYYREYGSKVGWGYGEGSPGTFLEKVHHGAPVILYTAIQVSSGIVEIQVLTEIEDGRTRERFGTFTDAKEGVEALFLNNTELRMITTWKFGPGATDGIETTLGPKGYRSNPYNGKFMSFQDTLLEHELLPKECKKYFDQDGEKLQVSIAPSLAEKYQSNRSHIQKSWRITFVINSALN